MLDLCTHRGRINADEEFAMNALLLAHIQSGTATATVILLKLFFFSLAGSHSEVYQGYMVDWHPHKISTYRNVAIKKFKGKKIHHCRHW